MGASCLKNCTITHIHPLKQLHDWDGLRARVPLGMVVNAAQEEQHKCRAAVGSQGHHGRQGFTKREGRKPAHCCQQLSLLYGETAFLPALSVHAVN